MRCPVFLFFFLISFFVYAQNPTEGVVHKIMFYNVENLFDTVDDSLTNDDEFTPFGDRHWTVQKLEQKIALLAKVIVAVGEWERPAIIGLCEVENLFVLEKLAAHPLLQKSNYRIIHKDSPDKRGIDVALLYRKDIFIPEDYSLVQITDSENNLIETREILHVQGAFASGEKIHFFVNHWPSRYGGLMETEANRARAAACLRKAILVVQEAELDARIICMGDFNDQPWDASLAIILGAVKPSNINADNSLVNLAWDWKIAPTGTLKHLQEWAIFDQFIVSLNISSACSASIFSENYLLEKDRKFTGFKPFRTFVGFRYNGGFSDHLPIVLSLINKN